MENQVVKNGPTAAGAAAVVLVSPPPPAVPAALHPTPAPPFAPPSGNGHPAPASAPPAAEPRRPWFRHLFKFRLFSGEQPKISPHAVVDKEADIADDVEIGPFCVIGPDVKIGPGCRLFNNVTILGHTTIGAKNVFFPNAVIGAPPQDLKYKGGNTRLEIGDGNTFREASTVHVGTEKGGGVTRVGSENLVMINAHLGHDVQLGSRCIISNNTMIAGHVIIGNNVAMMG